MKKTLITFLLISFNAYSYPVGTQGERASSSTYPSKIIAPNFQITSVSGGRTRIETGNTNLLVNPSFEAATAGQGWTFTGSPGLTQTSNANDGQWALSMSETASNPLTASQSFTIGTLNTGLAGQQMMASIAVMTTASDTYVCDLINGAEDKCVYAPVTSLGGNSSYNIIQIPFVSPAATGTNSVGIRVKTLTYSAGAIVNIDNSFVGISSPFQNVSGAQLLGTVTITGCSSTWTSSSTTFADFSVQTGCVYTTTGQAQAPSTMIPAIKFASLPAGDYRLEYEGMAYSNGTTSRENYYQFWDGTNTARETSAMLGSANIALNSINQSISYSTTQSNITLSLRAKVDSGGTTNLYGTTATPGTIKVWYFPSPNKIYSQPCAGGASCENVFSAQVTTTTGVVANQNVNGWIASCTAANPSVCTFGTGIFTVAPNCSTMGNTQVNGIVSTNGVATTSSSISIYTGNTTTGAALGSQTIGIVCQKQGADYLATRAITGSFLYTPTLTGVANSKLFSAVITTTSGAVSNNMGSVITSCTAANPTVCTLTGLTVAPNCGILNQTGTTELISNNGTAPTSTSITLGSYNSTTGAAVASQVFTINCVGY